MPSGDLKILWKRHCQTMSKRILRREIPALIQWQTYLNKELFTNILSTIVLAIILYR